jgi:hypothetical protein
MGLMDTLLLTLVSAIACVVLPRIISFSRVRQANYTRPVSSGSNSLEFRQKITTFPYCTTYVLTKNPSCKFSPHFCTQCSPASW